MKFNGVVVAVAATVGLIGSALADPVPYCVSVNGGWSPDGTGSGTTFVARQFEVPAANKCAPWTGYAKSQATVVVTTTGTACLSDDGNVMTVAVIGINPNIVGSADGRDFIQFCPQGANCWGQIGVENNSLEQGSDIGFAGGAFPGGTAVQIDCTAALLDLPINHP